MNTLTKDGSWINNYDFFDSDDLNEKSVGGTIMKNLALVGSMFIPYVGPWIAGASVAT
jgi:3-methyladenine DNA glycosylase AlkC|nr:MAG TPA: envelope glycoprotein [Caudoviricetes sp.]